MFRTAPAAQMLGSLILLLAVLLPPFASAHTQRLPPVPEPPPRPVPPPPLVEKLTATTFRIGKLLVDKGRREVVAPGQVNPASVVEFVAGTRDGIKAYETAVTLDTDAVSYNTALLLIGLDPANARVPTRQFDTVPPAGDPVEITMSWMQGAAERRAPIEELLFDARSKKTLTSGPWVYTGSTFVDTGAGRRYLAELDGVLIGLMRGPQALIDNPRNDAVGGFGAIILNPKLPFPEGTTLSVHVRALNHDAGRKQ